MREGLERVQAAVGVDGEVVDCDAELPGRLFTHVWRMAQAGKARALRADIERHVHRLSEILSADFARSREGRSAESLQAFTESHDGLWRRQIAHAAAAEKALDTRSTDEQTSQQTSPHDERKRE